MRFWYYWWIGVIITVITRIGINRLSYDRDTIYYYGIKIHDEFKWKSEDARFLMHIPVFICISLVGGIVVAKFLCSYVANPNIWSNIIGMVFAGGLTYYVGWLILGLYHFQKISSQICFVVVFIVSVVCWTVQINNYNENIETTTEIVTTSTEERELLYFHDIPVQNVSGHIEGFSNLFVGSVSGNVKTKD